MTDTYRVATASIDDRVADLLARMTVEEKAAQLTAVWIDVTDRAQIAPREVDGDAAAAMNTPDALAHGIGHVSRPYGSRPLDPSVGIDKVNALQRRLVEQTRLGIPAICHEECLSGLMAQDATSFPCPLNLASTWDPQLVRHMAAVIRRQMRTIGTHQGLAPVADVARDARWGRVEETFGEEPYLVAVLTAAYVEGLQGDDLSNGVAATLKHYAGYSFSEGGRNVAPVHVGRRELADVFLPPFEMAVRDAGARSVMPAYVAIDGEAAHGSRWLLSDVLREAWGFRGTVVSDYFGVSNLRDQDHVATDRATAVATALTAGMDVELPFPAEMVDGVPEALDRGLLDMARVDLAVARVLRLKFELGLFERPYVEPLTAALEQPSDRELARTIGVRSITLLQNGGVLPLDGRSAKVAVIGPNADDSMALFGDYSFESHVLARGSADGAVETQSPTVLEALRTRLNQSVSYVEGAHVMDGELGGIPEAVAAARAADVAVVVLGDRSRLFGEGTVGEGSDASDLSLPGGQTALLEAVLGSGTPVVLVLLSGRPYDLTAASSCAAIMEAWFPGQEGAHAIADVLLGDAEPGGRSPVTFSAGAGFQPMYVGPFSTSPGSPPLKGFDAVFPFGHGLSYTTFDYSDLDAPTEVAIDGCLEVSCSVRNSGTRAGEDVVQLYIRDRDACVLRPVQQLVGFQRVALAPGQEARITWQVPTDLLAYSGIEYTRILEPGPVDLLVGASSSDIRLEAECLLTGPVRHLDADRLRSSTATAVLSPSP